MVDYLYGIFFRYWKIEIIICLIISGFFFYLKWFLVNIFNCFVDNLCKIVGCIMVYIYCKNIKLLLILDSFEINGGLYVKYLFIIFSGVLINLG